MSHRRSDIPFPMPPLLVSGARLALVFLWNDVVLFSPLVFPASPTGSIHQNIAVHAISLAAALCAGLLLALCRKMAVGAKGVPPAIGIAGAGLAVVATALMAAPLLGAPFASELVAIGGFVGGMGFCSMLILSLSELAAAAECPRALLALAASRVGSCILFFALLGMPPQAAWCLILLLPAVWYGLGRHRDCERPSPSTENDSLQDRPPLRSAAVARILALLLLLFFLASFPRGSVFIDHNSDAKLLFWQLTLLVTFVLAACLLTLLARAESYDKVVLVTLFVSLAILFVVFMAYPLLNETSIDASWLTLGLRNFCDLLCIAMVVLVVRARHMAPFPSFAVFLLVRFLGATLGLFAASALIVTHQAAAASVITSLVALAALILTVVTLLVRDFDMEDGRPPLPSDAPPSLDDFARRWGLSARETEVLEMLSSGYSISLISERLFLSPNTVRTYVRNLHQKTGVSTRDELILLVESGTNGATSSANQPIP